MRIPALAVLSLLLLAKGAHAEAILANGAGVYAVPSKSAWFQKAVTPELVRETQFLAFNMTWLDGAATTKLEHDAKLGEHTFLDKPIKEKPPDAEGCAESPLEWMRNGKKVARVAKKLRDGSFLLGLPTGFQEKKLSAEERAKVAPRLKAPLEKPGLNDADKCAKQGAFYANGDDVLALCMTDNGLNYVIAVLSQHGKSTWQLEQTFTVSDDCP